MVSEKFYIQNSVDLLSPSFYQRIMRTETYIIVISVFKEFNYNFIIPLVKADKLDQKGVKVDLQPWKAKGYGFSYYIDEYLIKSYEGTEIISSIRLYDDLYTFKWMNEQFALDDEFEVVEMDLKNYGAFLSLVDICFPEKDNDEFMKWCLDNKLVKTFGVIIGGEIIAFGSFMRKRNSEYALLFNDGTHPDFRRKGAHSYLTKYRINQIMKGRKRLCIYANVEKMGASHMGFVKLGFINGPHYFVYEEGIL